MTYVVFTSDELPLPHDLWPEHEHQQEDQPALKAMPIQGKFAVEKPDGTVKKCDGDYGFLVLRDTGELGFITVSDFQANYKGGEHLGVNG